MITQKYLDSFNKDAIVPFSRVRENLLIVKQFSSSDKEEKLDTTGDFSESMIEFGVKIQEKLSKAKEALKDDLIVIFFKLSNDESNNLGLMEREEMYAMIETAQPETISFLALTSNRAKKAKDVSQAG